MTMPWFFRRRDAIATLPALLILAILIFAGVQKAVKIVPHHDASLVQIALMAPEPTPPQPTPPAPTPPPRVVAPQPRPTSVARTPSPAVSASPGSHAAAEVAAALPAPPPVAAPPPAPAKASVASVDISLEKTYYAKLKAEVERQKVYPRSREASMEQPQGKVLVWLEVSRNGEVIGSGIETPASSMLLNRAAEGSLRRLKQVEKFPPEAFAGIDKKRFTVTFNYSINSTEEQHDSQAN